MPLEPRLRPANKHCVLKLSEGVGNSLLLSSGEASLLERVHDLRLIHPGLNAAVDDDGPRVTKGFSDSLLCPCAVADHAQDGYAVVKAMQMGLDALQPSLRVIGRQKGPRVRVVRGGAEGIPSSRSVNIALGGLASRSMIRSACQSATHLLMSL